MNIERLIVLRIARSERGIAFVVSLVTMLVLVILGYGLLVATDGSTRTDNGLKAQTIAFESADSGIELARERIRQCLAGAPTPLPSICPTQKTLSQLLADAGGGIDSTSLAGFPNTSATTNGTGNTPLVASDSSTLSPTSFQVFLTNDPQDGVTTTTDGAAGIGHNRVTLTSFAAGANNIGYAVLQSIVEIPELEGLINAFPGTLVLPGPTVNFAPFNSNNGKILNTSPNCGATILVTSNASRNAIVDPTAGIPSNRLDNQHYSSCLNGGGTDANNGIYNLLPANLSPWEPNQTVDPAPPAGIPSLAAPQDNIIKVAFYTALRDQIAAVATFRSVDDANFTYGTTTNPQVVYINQDLSMGPEANGGAGIVLTTGNLDIHGNPSYTGLILMIGDNKTVTFSGGGMGTFTGSMVVANIHPWSDDATYVSAPNFNGNGGSTTWGYGGATGVNSIPFVALAPPRRITFSQLR